MSNLSEIFFPAQMKSTSGASVSVRAEGWPAF